MKNQEVLANLDEQFQGGRGRKSQIGLGSKERDTKESGRASIAVSRVLRQKGNSLEVIVDKGFGSRELLFCFLLFPVLFQKGKLSERVC